MSFFCSQHGWQHELSPCPSCVHYEKYGGDMSAEQIPEHKEYLNILASANEALLCKVDAAHLYRVLHKLYYSLHPSNKSLMTSEVAKDEARALLEILKDKYEV